MKIVLQRVRSASVMIEKKRIASIGQGLVLLVGIGPTDTQDDIDYLVRKITHMRIFSDENGKMNHSIKEMDGEILSVSQFTLYADTKKGNRPAFTGAAKPDVARQLYHDFNERLRQECPVQTGVFAADMQLSLINDGPVTILLDSQNP